MDKHINKWYWNSLEKQEIVVKVNQNKDDSPELLKVYF